MLSIFCSPGRYVQGRHATQQLGQEMTKLGLTGTVVLVAGKSALSLLEQTWKEAFQAQGIKYRIIEFQGQCSLLEIARIKAIAQAEGATAIVGAGGGKVLDTAQAVADELHLPVVNCPTAASSDASCSALSVVYTPEGRFEKYIFYRKNPDLVLVDSSVIAQAPARLLVAGMGDALATWFEARTVRQAGKANQVGGATTESASALAHLCYNILIEDGAAALAAVKVKSVTPALERLIEANTLLSGLGFESGGLAVAHSVHNGLTVAEQTHDYLHGEKVAFGLLVQLILEGQPDKEIEAVLAFSESVGLPITLSQVGLDTCSSALLQEIAERAVAPGETAHNEPFAVSAEMILDAIMAADAIGRRFHGIECGAKI